MKVRVFCIVLCILSICSIFVRFPPKDVYAISFNHVVELWGVKLIDFGDEKSKNKVNKKSSEVTVFFLCDYETITELQSAFPNASIAVQYRSESGDVDALYKEPVPRLVTQEDIDLARLVKANFSKEAWTALQKLTDKVVYYDPYSKDIGRKSGADKDEYEQLKEMFMDMSGNSGSDTLISNTMKDLKVGQSDISKEMSETAMGISGQISYFLLILANLCFTLQVLFEICLLVSVGFRNIVFGTQNKLSSVLSHLVSKTCLKAMSMKKVKCNVDGKLLPVVVEDASGSDEDVKWGYFFFRKSIVLVIIVFFWVLLATGLLANIALGASRFLTKTFSSIDSSI